MVKQLHMVTEFSEISVATIENGDKKDQILMKRKQCGYMYIPLKC